MTLVLLVSEWQVGRRYLEHAIIEFPHKILWKEKQTKMGFDHQRLTLGRHLLGVRRDELAARCFVSPREVMLWENGYSTPNSSNVENIVDTLRLPQSFFEKPGSDRNYSYPTEPLFIDEGGQSGWHDADMSATAYMKLVHETAYILNEYVSLPEINLLCLPADPTTYRSPIPELAAEQVRAHWGLGGDPISNLVQHIESDGVILSYTPQNIITETYSLQGGQPIIIINPQSRDYYKLRLKIAQQLGHLIMHFDGEPRNNIAVRDAKRFAAALLTPEQAYDNFPRRRNNETMMVLKDFKEQWGVPIRFIVEQLRAYKIWGDHACNDTLNEMKYLKWWVSEPGERTVELEELSTLPKRAEKIFATHPVGTIIDKCRLPDWLFRTITAPLPLQY